MRDTYALKVLKGYKDPDPLRASDSYKPEDGEFMVTIRTNSD